MLKFDGKSTLWDNLVHQVNHDAHEVTSDYSQSSDMNSGVQASKDSASFKGGNRSVINANPTNPSDYSPVSAHTHLNNIDLSTVGLFIRNFPQLNLLRENHDSFVSNGHSSEMIANYPNGLGRTVAVLANAGRGKSLLMSKMVSSMRDSYKGRALYVLADEPIEPSLSSVWNGPTIISTNTTVDDLVNLMLNLRNSIIFVDSTRYMFMSGNALTSGGISREAAIGLTTLQKLAFFTNNIIIMTVNLNETDVDTGRGLDLIAGSVDSVIYLNQFTSSINFPLARGLTGFSKISVNGSFDISDLRIPLTSRLSTQGRDLHVVNGDVFIEIFKRTLDQLDQNQLSYPFKAEDDSINVPLLSSFTRNSIIDSSSLISSNKSFNYAPTEVSDFFASISGVLRILSYSPKKKYSHFVVFTKMVTPYDFIARSSYAVKDNVHKDADFNSNKQDKMTASSNNTGGDNKDDTLSGDTGSSDRFHQ